MSLSDDYLIGFVEGEGMFYIGIVPSKETKSGWQVIYFFKVSQNPVGKTVLEELKKRGATYRVHDPYVQGDEEYGIESELDIALKDSDAVVLMTKHEEYGSISPEKLKGLIKTRVIVDGRNLFDPDEFRRQGFIFKGIGKGN